MKTLNDKNEINNIIYKALKGDEEAYTILLKRYKYGIFKMIYQMIKNKEETEDIVQETFIKAFNSLHSYNSKYAFSTWLYKIAYNHCIDKLRKKKLKTQSLDKPIELKEGSVKFQIKDDRYNPEKSVILDEKKNKINLTINSLPEKYKKVIIYRHHKDKSYHEISKELNIPLGTVKARIFRARELLKKKLKESHYL
ncbi:MAG: sigma-70 family RNA polymerase sigma factor [bacterium]